MPYDVSAYAHVLWVAADGSDTGTGATDAPFASIGAALAAAAPDTIVLLKPGTYTETVTIGPDWCGAQDAPIAIAAADGPGTVNLVGLNPKASTIRISGHSNVGIYDLNVVGVGSTTGYDNAAIKVETPNGIVPENISITGNTIAGTGRDGIKVATADHLTIAHNLITGAFGQEGIDLFSVHDAKILGNVISADAAFSAICMKAGSEDVTIADNLFNGTSTCAIKLGGPADADPAIMAFSDARSPGVFQAARVAISGNVMLGHADHDVIVRGAEDVTVDHNYFGSDSQYGDKNANVASVVVSDFELGTDRASVATGIVVEDNVTERAGLLKQVAAIPVTDAGNVSTYGSPDAPAALQQALDAIAAKTGSFALPLEVTRDTLVQAADHAISAQDVLSAAPAMHDVQGLLADFLADRLTLTGLEQTIRHGNVVEDVQGVAPADQAANITVMGEATRSLAAGSDGLNALIGNDLNNNFKGGDGSDFLYGGNGNDYLAGGNGDDLLVFGPGSDRAMGGRGADTFYFTADAHIATIRDLSPEDHLVVETSFYDSPEALLAAAEVANNGDVKVRMGGGDFLVFENTDLETVHHANLDIHII
jgi:Ca2+-binding RTX toxin-like protein